MTPTRGAASARLGRAAESGSAMLELALLLPLVAALSLGVVDLGRAYWLKTRLVSAATSGSTYAQSYPSQVTAGPGCSDPYNVVYVAQHEEGTWNAFDVDVASTSMGGAPITGCNSMTIQPGTQVTVVVSAPFKMFTPILSLVMSGSTTLHASSQVVVQG